MTITTIADPSIKLIASKRLCQYVADLGDHVKMPANVAAIFASRTGKDIDKIGKFTGEVDNIKYTVEEDELLKEADGESDDVQRSFRELIPVKENETEDEAEPETSTTKKNKKPKKQFYLTLKDIKWLNMHLKECRQAGESSVYMHELIQECELVLPANEVIERNPELEARCQKLRRAQEEWQYYKMTKNVDNVMKSAPEDTISYQCTY